MAKPPNNERHRGRYTAVTPDPPDGGWGIVVVIASHLAMALVIGLVRCSGVYYLSWRSEFGTSARQTAAVQSITISMAAFSGIIGGILTKRYGCRLTGVLGGAVASCGLLVSGWAGDIYQLYVTAAVVGTGMGIVFNVSIVAVALYFRRRYKTANAVALAGGGTGIIAAPPLLQLLSENYGWRGAALISSAVMANGAALCLLFRPLPRRVEPPAPGPTGRGGGDGPPGGGGAPVSSDARGADAEEGDPPCTSVTGASEASDEAGSSANESAPPEERGPSSAVANRLKRYSRLLGLNVFCRSYRFGLMCLLQFELTLPYTSFVQFLVPRAEDLGVAPSSAALLLSLFGVGLLLGRLANGALISWRATAEHVTAAGMALAGLSLLLANVDSYAALAVASLANGFALGFLMAVMVVLTRRYVGLANFALCVALFGLFVGAGVLTGPVMAGWLLDLTGSYKTAFYVLAGVYFLCVVQMLLLPLLKRIEPGIEIRPSDR